MNNKVVNVCTSCECVDNECGLRYNLIVNTSLILNKTCSVFGHSKIEITDSLKEKIHLTFENLIKQENVGYFYFGGFGEFDDLCWRVVTSLKAKYPNIKRIFCLSDPRHQRISKRPKWLKDEDYEKIVYLDLDFDYWYTRIYYRNVEMVNRSDFVVFYVNHSKQSGAYKILQYAMKKKKHIINVATNIDF